jgi:hypothetical protein
MLSDAGTWRRWLLLALAIFACLLPRENPINHIIAAVRRHVDNLVGPLAPPKPQGQAHGQAGNAPANVGNNACGQGVARQPGSTTAPTPEEATARLLREHQERNSNVFHNTLFRVGRAMALFLTSLVQGVEESHVSAREEARRVLTEGKREGCKGGGGERVGDVVGGEVGQRQGEEEGGEKLGEAEPVETGGAGGERGSVGRRDEDTLSHTAISEEPTITS